MQTLRQAASTAQGELWQLDFIDLDKAEIKEDVFNKTEKGTDGKDTVKTITYKVMIIDGKKFSIKDKQLNALKALLETKPTLKKVKLMKLDDGKLQWIPIE